MSANLSETVKSALEAYIEGDKAKAFSILIPGSEWHYYLSILDALKSEKHKPSKQTRKLVQEFGDRYGGENFDRTRLRLLLQTLEGEGNEKERKKLVDQLQNEWIYAQFHHTKPADLKRKEKKVEKEYNVRDHTFFADEHIIKTKAYLEQMVNEYRQNELSPHFHNQLDYTKLKDGRFEQFANSLADFGHIEEPSFLKELKAYFDRKWKEYQYYSVEQQYLEKCTIGQLEKLGKMSSKVKNDHAFIGTLFKKQFHEKLDSERIHDLTHEQRREELIEMYECSKGHPQSFRTSLLQEIIENGVKLDIFDKGYFLEYLRHPSTTWFLNDKKHKSGYQDSTWNQYLGPVQNNYGNVDYSNQEELFYKYLEKFYHEAGGNLKAFQEHFEKGWWERTITKIEFLAGKDIKSLSTKDTGIDFEALAKEVKIELVDSNKPVFKREERVRIVAELKNVPQLYVHIYEFNSENYYRKKMAPFRTDVNLDGLIAQHEEKFEFAELPQMKFRHVFDFP